DIRVVNFGCTKLLNIVVYSHVIVAIWTGNSAMYSNEHDAYAIYTRAPFSCREAASLHRGPSSDASTPTVSWGRIVQDQVLAKKSDRSLPPTGRLLRETCCLGAPSTVFHL